MLVRLILIAVMTFACKSTSNQQFDLASKDGKTVVSPEQRSLLAEIIREFYGAPVPGIKDKLPNLAVEDVIIRQFANSLYNSDDQTSRKLFLELVSRSDAPSDELKTYVVQEFITMTNIIQKTAAKIGPGIEIPLTFIGSR